MFSSGKLKMIILKGLQNRFLTFGWLNHNIGAEDRFTFYEFMLEKHKSEAAWIS